MSEIVASGIIEKQRLVAFLETFASKPTGMKQPLVGEAKIHLDGDGMHATAVDAAKHTMVGPVTLTPEAFESYDASGQAVMGVTLTKILDRLSPADAGALVEFELDMETRHLRLSYGAANVSVALIDPETIRSEPDVSELDLPNEVVITGDQLDHAADVTDMVSDHLSIAGDPDADSVSFTASGDVDDSEVIYENGDCVDTDLSEGVYSLFSLAYFKAVAKPIPDDAEVRLQFGDEFPLRVEWSAFDGSLDAVQTIAPRLEG